MKYSQKLFILFLLLFSSLHSNGQKMTKVFGKVISSETKEPLPFVNITFENSNVGTVTNFDGDFILDSKWATDHIKASFLGFENSVKKVEVGKNKKINFELKPKSISLETVTVKAKKIRYRNKSNPSVELIKKVIDNKYRNKKSYLSYYEYDKYEKVEFDLNNFGEDFLKNKFLNSIQLILENYVDTSEINGKPYIPIFIKESSSKVYYRNAPTAKKEYLFGTKISGSTTNFDEEGVGAVLQKLYSEFDIYDNEIQLLSKKFPSPISNIAPVIYKYFIIDTLMINNRECINLAFSPRAKSDFAFTGNLYILNDSTNAVVKVEMGINNRINLNFVDDLKITQEFEKINDEVWMLSKDEIIIDYSVSKSEMGVFGKRKNSYKNYVVNKQRNDSIYSPSQNVIETYNMPANNDDLFWENARHQALTKKEKEIYVMADSIQNNKAFKKIVRTVDIASFGWFTFDKFELGPYITAASWNQVEGWKYRLGGRTTNGFHPKILLESYLSYSHKDDRFKYLGGVTYSFNKSLQDKKSNEFSFSVSKEAYFPGENVELVDNDNFFLSFKRGTSDKMLLEKKVDLKYFKEFESGFSYTLGVKNITSSAIGNWSFNNIYGENLGAVKTDEIEINLRYAPNERYYKTKNNRLPIHNKYPIFSINHQEAIKGVLDGEHNFSKTKFNFFKRVFIPLMGQSDFRLEVGKVWGETHFTLLHIPQANQSLSLQENSFNMMNFMEFVNDEYISLKWTHFFNGFLLNKVPLLSRIKLREVFGGKIIYGRLTDINNPYLHPELAQFPADENGNPITHSLEEKPYLEVNVGISNIFKILRIDLIKRLTYLDPDTYSVNEALGVRGLGIRAKLVVDF
jgi:hypothetical protein